MEKDNKKSRKLILIFAIMLQAIGIFLLVYLFVLPFYPVLKYEIMPNKEGAIVNISDISSTSDIIQIREQAKNFRNGLPEAEYSVSKNRLIISKIGVNAPIVESDNEAYGLSKGAWRIPESSTPDKGGNVVLTGHRFRYLPPNNLTFYLFHKLEKGDIVSVIWEDKDYLYKVKEKKIVPSTEISIMNQTKEHIITMYTCDPIYSTKNRLVVIAEPIN